MRLDHLLSKRSSRVLFHCWVIRHASVWRYAYECKHSTHCFSDPCGSKITLYFWWRCAWGEHPLTSRTRWLRLRRPTVLGWRRPGRIGGRQIFLFIEKKTIYSSFECSSYWTPEWLINSVNLRDQGVPWKLHTDRRIDKKTFWICRSWADLFANEMEIATEGSTNIKTSEN